MKKYLILFILFFALACENQQTDPVNKNVKPIELGGGGELVVTASNEFGLDLFREIVAEEPADKNLFISPTSISLALAMTWNGANNATEEAMKDVLHLSNLDSNEVNAVYRDLMKGLTTVDDKVTLSIANSIWYRQGFDVEDDFIAINRNYYNAKVEGLDFGDPTSKNIINDWVEDQTNGKITDLVREISNSSVMFLINAIYFNGKWKVNFNPKETYVAPFNLTSGNIDSIAMMYRFDTLNYFENDLFQSVELDYGIGNYSMVVLLPKGDKTTKDITDQLKPGNWDNWIKSHQPAELKLSLPQIKFNYDLQLCDALSKMGMEIAFTDNADFTGIKRDGGLKINSVRHKSFIEVNEDGTEAAAATIVEMAETTSIDQPVIKSMCVNRPFLFAIREKSTGAIVFMGRVCKTKE